MYPFWILKSPDCEYSPVPPPAGTSPTETYYYLESFTLDRLYIKQLGSYNDHLWKHFCPSMIITCVFCMASSFRIRKPSMD